MKRFCLNCGRMNERIGVRKVSAESYLVDWTCGKCGMIYTYRHGKLLAIEIVSVSSNNSDSVLITPQDDGTLYIFRDEKVA